MHIPLNVFRLFKDMTIYIAIAMSVIEGISIMSKSGCDDKELLDYVYENHDEIECKLNVDYFSRKILNLSVKPHSICTMLHIQNDSQCLIHVLGA